MNKHLIVIGIVILLLAVGLSGCFSNNSNNEYDDSGGSSTDGFFILSGTITNNYNENIELDMAILAVENRDYDWEYWAPTKYFDYLDVKEYSFKVKSGYLKYQFLVQWYLPDNTPGYYLDDFSFTNPSGSDITYNVRIDNQGVIHIS